ncbi:uncharacterized protein LOC117649534 [Thrips palmi]|uniref:Uncharacterized protein LOC117649534 n=1 Tax=Thrips palmi TaxID=161013 RepID=A0A6P8ZSR4_THRPL|nr:uncharacterized protein LOC117649534 [Thrips palmi]
MAAGSPPRVEVSELNDLLIRCMASKLPEPEQQNVLAWACRLREDRRLSSLQLLLEALLDAVKPGGRLDGRFAEPVPSDRALPTVQEISQMGVSVRALLDVGVQADAGWARDAVREYAVHPEPAMFLGVQPKPRNGAMCYMSVFGS